MSQNKIRAIAFYLPQFYPTPENDEWWEPGFTEWTNVVKAKPLFKGHYQPRIPRDLGFYDLRVPETREKQAELAREAGIEGFCYWHYWFNGRRLLDQVFHEVVETGKPNFPFCLCWANHSWYAKTWNPDVPDKLLVEQTYGGVDDYTNHFNAMLPAFKDKRYINVNGRPIFGIFDPIRFDDFNTFKDTWNKLAKKNGLEDFYFFGLCQGSYRIEQTHPELYDAIVLDTMMDIAMDNGKKHSGNLEQRIRNKFHIPVVTQYSDYVKKTVEIFKDHSGCIPCVDPDFDHSPRSGYQGMIFHNSNPDEWANLLKQTKGIISNKHTPQNLMFIKAWNEWGEGCYMEPDQRWGKRYITEMAKVIKPHE